MRNMYAARPAYRVCSTPLQKVEGNINALEEELLRSSDIAQAVYKPLYRALAAAEPHKYEHQQLCR